MAISYDRDNPVADNDHSVNSATGMPVNGTEVVAPLPIVILQHLPN